MTQPAPDPCELLVWDCEFFGFKIARVSQLFATDEDLNLAIAWCRKNSIRCLYWLAAGDYAPAVVLANQHGFRFVDMRVELEAPIQEGGDAPSLAGEIRPAVPNDLPALQKIARQAHSDSRFHRDPGFGARHASDLFATWIEKDCRDSSGIVWVAVARDGQPAGYATCQTHAGTGRIGLFAVAAGSRQFGLGSMLLGACMKWFQEHGAVSARVTTQGANVAAQRVYQKGGFRTCSADVWYHRWFTE